MSNQIEFAKDMLGSLCRHNCYFMHMENPMLERHLVGTTNEMIGMWMKKLVCLCAALNECTLQTAKLCNCKYTEWMKL